MPDAWILAWLARGIIASAGDTMPLDECQWRAADLSAQHTHVVCINAQDPSCRIYRDAPRDELADRCVRRLKKETT